MKTIWLIRHSKSDWGNSTLHDFERHLNARGYADANKMSLILKSKNEIPDIIITSPAIRSITTAVIFSKTIFGHTQLLKTEDKLYDTTELVFKKIIEKTYPLYNAVFFVSHNPSITNLANMLTDANIPNIPTTGIVKITFDVGEWKDIANGCGTLEYFDYPKNH